MNSEQLVSIHVIVVILFLVIYLLKTVLLFTSKSSLIKFTKATRVPEMIISVAFLVTGVWLFAILGAIKVFHIIKLACIVIAIPLAVVGFKKQSKSLALISFLLIVGSYGLAEMAKNKPFIPTNVIVDDSSNEPFLTGMKTFAANCAMCHGLDGKKLYRNAIDLSSSSLDPFLVTEIIHDGSKGKMPAFEGTLSDVEIDAVARYLMTLRGK